jgi:hypothetical protein
VFAGDVLVVTRGTASGHDWVSNLNIGLDRCSSGTMVHAGFNRVWSGFAPRGARMVQSQQSNAHPLRGAQLGRRAGHAERGLFRRAGDRRSGALHLRLAAGGQQAFGERLTQRIGGGNIHRVAHPADPVPMIPLLPFFHVPWATGGIMLPNPAGAIVGIDHHLMGPTYVRRPRTRVGAGLRAAAVNPNAEAEVRNWLQRAADNSGNGLLMGSASLLTMIGRALGWILVQAGKLVANTLSAAATGGLTLLDRLAWMITEGARVSAELAGYTLTLLRAIFRFLGRVANTAAEITTAFLRWVLNLLFTTVSTAARAALDGVARLAR